MKKTFLLFLIILACLWGCAKKQSYVSAPPPRDTIPVPETGKGEIPEPYVVFGKRYYPLPDSHGFVQYGKASWYGKKFHGRRTSSGEIYDMYKRTAAHKTLPLGTYVKVMALGKEVGTQSTMAGTRPLVALEDLRTGIFTIQVGAFQEKENALRLAERLRSQFTYVQVSVYVDENKRTLHRVQVSKTTTLSQAGEMEKKLEAMGFREAFIVRI